MIFERLSFKQIMKKLFDSESPTIINITDKTHVLYQKKNNKCVVRLRNTKKNYYENLDEKNVTDNTNFERL